MSYHPRIETGTVASFLTTRSRNSELWFVNNALLESAILGYAAKFAQRYGVTLYALAIEGNHIQGPALFPGANRASFMRDLNACVARAMPRHVSSYPGGRFWGRRYSNEFLPGPDDIEDRFFYTVLQPVQDGLVEKLSEYPWYNCFQDAIWGRTKRFRVVNWGGYNKARETNPHVSVRDFTEIVKLKYERLPGYEALSQREYAELMKSKLEHRRLDIVAKRGGLPFLGRRKLLAIRPGANPFKTKRSNITTHRPRILCVCPKRRTEYEGWYFSVFFAYKEASLRFRNGELDVEFPPGTFKPMLAPSPQSVLRL